MLERAKQAHLTIVDLQAKQEKLLDGPMDRINDRILQGYQRAEDMHCNTLRRYYELMDPEETREMQSWIASL